MISKELLKYKYGKLIEQPIEEFIKEATFIQTQFKDTNLNVDRPLLIYGNNNRNACVYSLGVNYSILNKKVLDYTIITAPHFINQHFLSEEHRDMELYQNMYYTDLLFITISQLDYKHQYLESLLIDLIETRLTSNKLTHIYFETNGSKKNNASYMTLFNYLTNKQLALDITATTKPSSFSKPTQKASKETTTKGGVKFF